VGKFALLIGVSEYPEGFSALPAALNDVAAMREVLECPEMGGFEVTALLNPTEGDFRRSVEGLFLNRASEDLVLLYFSGHGITEPGGKFFFSTKRTKKDARGRLSKATAIPATEIYDYLADCESDRKVVILDCCHSGAFGDLIPRDGGDIDFQGQLGGMGRVVLTASAAIDYSFERADEPLAIYTRYLVEGIKTGAADKDEDGWVSVDELHDFVVEKLSKAAPGMTPQRYVAKDGEKIKLTRAIVADPTKKYRKFVQQYIRDGEIGPTGRRILNGKRLELKLNPETALTIENDECQPYREHKKNLQEYEACLIEELEFKFPLGDRAKTDLQDYWKKELRLTADEVAAIENRVIDAFAASHPILEPIVPPIPTPEPIAPPEPLPKPKLPTFAFEVVTVDVTGKEIARKPGSAVYFKEDWGDGVTLDMVKIPGGSFEMGTAKSGFLGKKEEGASGNEFPQHKVNVKEFWMGKFAVTQAQWKKIASLDQVNIELNPDPSNFKGSNLPVEKISWHEAKEFCDRLSRLSQKTGKIYDLPTEAQWEYACRAGTTTPFHFGETITSDLVTFDGDYTYGKASKGRYRKTTIAVDSFTPNAFGLYNMHGNIWEWCLDPWHSNYDGAPTHGGVWNASNDSGSDFRLMRGGSWNNNPHDCRSAGRVFNGPAGQDDALGFRIVCSSLSQGLP
jgi:formylglycine-generating enzyme required for sulfatase activity